MSNVCEAAWGHVNVDAAVPPFVAESATSQDWTSAFESRSGLLDLIVSNPRPRYLQYHGSALEWQQVVELIKEARVQGHNQLGMFNAAGKPMTKLIKMNICKTLTAPSHARRPFCQVRTKSAAAEATLKR